MAAEIISTVERRRLWPDEEKRRILSEALAPGVTIAAVADRNGVCRSLLYTWLRLAREGRLPGVSIAKPLAPTFVPVRIDPRVSSQPPEPAPARLMQEVRPPVSSRRRTSVVEITLGNGRSLKAEDSIDPVTLARLVSALDGGSKAERS
jgi:transposase